MGSKKDQYKSLMCLITGDFCELEENCEGCGTPSDYPEEVAELNA